MITIDSMGIRQHGWRRASHRLGAAGRPARLQDVVMLEPRAAAVRITSLASAREACRADLALKCGRLDRELELAYVDDISPDECPHVRAVLRECEGIERQA